MATVKKFHLTPEGPKPCSASKRPCKYGEGDHYASQGEAQAAYEQLHASYSFSSHSKRKQGSAVELAAELERMKTLKDEYGLFQASLRQKKVEAFVEKLVEDGETTDKKYGRWVGEELTFSPERRREQEALMSDILSRYEEVPEEGEVVVAGGLGGAGKTTVLSLYAGLSLENYAALNPDDVKEEMAARGMIPAVKGLTPMEASPLVHEEASHITKLLMGKLAARKKNILLDVTMAGLPSLEKKVHFLKESGYTKVEAVFVDIEPSTSLERAAYRYREGMNDYLEGRGLGGRVLPHHVVTNQVPKDKRYHSHNAEVLVEATKRGLFTGQPRVFDNNRTGEEPQEIAFDDFHHDNDAFITWERKALFSPGEEL